jgi:acetyl esterase/lipase
VAGDTLIFPSGPSQVVMNNDLAPGTAFALVQFQAAYTLNGNTLTLAGDLTPAGTCNANVQFVADARIFSNQSAVFNGTVDINGFRVRIDQGTRFNGGFSGTGIIDEGGIFNSLGLEVYGGGPYSGTINGKLILHNGASLPNAIVHGDLIGDGTVGNAFVEGSSHPSAGFLLPGQGNGGIGTLHTKNLNTVNAASFGADLNPAGASDQVVVTGTVTLGGVFGATLAGPPPAVGQPIILIDNDGSDPIVGTFNGLPEGSTLTVDGTALTVSYVGGDGNDFTLTNGAITKQWTGATNGHWSVGSNWSPAGMPAANQPLHFPASATTFAMNNDLPPGQVLGPIQVDGSYTVGGNTLNFGADVHGGFTCNADVKLVAPLTLFGGLYNGAVDINGQHVTIQQNDTFNGPLTGTGIIDTAGPFNWLGLEVYGGGSFSGTINGRVSLHGGASLPNATLVGQLRGIGTMGNTNIQFVSVVPGYLLPGDFASAGTGLLHTKNLSLGGAAYLVDLDPAGTSDSVQVTGSVTISDGLGVASVASTPAAGQMFVIIDNDGIDPVNGTFNSLPEGAVFSANGVLFRISYVGNDGNDVVLTRVLPSSVTMGQSVATTKRGQEFNLTATVTGPPSGTVNFYDNGVLIGSGSILGGVVTLPIGTLAVGTHANLTATFTGSPTHAASTSSPLSHLVERGDVTVTVIPPPGLFTYGMSLPFIVHVTATAPATGQPAGSVTSDIPGAPSSALLVSGSATFGTSLLPAGTTTVHVNYPGDTDFAPGTGSVTMQIGKAHATIAARSLRSPSPAGEDVLLSVSVSSAAPVAGTVTVSENGETLLQQAIGSAPATLAIPGMIPGLHTLTVTFSDPNFETASDTVTQRVSGAALSLAGTAVAEGNSGTKVVTLSVHLSAPSLEPVTVAFATNDGTAKAGEDYLAASGTLTFAPGQTAKPISVTIVGDTTLESDEQFLIVLSSPAGALLDGGPATVTILNDDASFHASAFEYANPGGTSLMLDVYTPVTGNGPFPVVLWIPGTVAYAPSGDPAALRQTMRGYVVIVASYRAAGMAPFPAQLDDLKAAVRWIRANAVRLNIDPQHLGVWGSGAGGHLAALLGTTGDTASAGSLAEGNPAFSNRVQVVIDWGGAADLLHLQADAPASCAASFNAPTSPQSLLLGCALQACSAAALAASPQSFITSDDAPTLLMHGAADCVVPAEQSRRFYTALRAAGVEATLNVIDGVGPFDTYWLSAVANAQVDAFLDAHLKTATTRRRGAGH